MGKRQYKTTGDRLTKAHIPERSDEPRIDTVRPNASIADDSTEFQYSKLAGIAIKPSALYVTTRGAFNIGEAREESEDNREKEDMVLFRTSFVAGMNFPSIIGRAKFELA